MSAGGARVGVVEESLAGGLAGLVATLAMSVPMLVARSMGMDQTLPPEQIATEAARDAGASPESPNALGSLAHLAFGASVGAAFPVLGRVVRFRSHPMPALLYALGVWWVSYQGWVPRLGFMPPASRDDRLRTAVMIGSHAVFGLTLGQILETWGKAAAGAGRFRGQRRGRDSGVIG